LPRFARYGSLTALKVKVLREDRIDVPMPAISFESGTYWM
jgi:hypothetical protein